MIVAPCVRSIAPPPPIIVRTKQTCFGKSHLFDSNFQTPGSICTKKNKTTVGFLRSHLTQEKEKVTSLIKVVCSHRILTSQGLTGSSTFSGVKWKPIFSQTPKSSASNSLYFGSYSRKCTYFQCTNFDFLMYFHNSLISTVAYIFLPWGDNKK